MAIINCTDEKLYHKYCMAQERCCYSSNDLKAVISCESDIDIVEAANILNRADLKLYETYLEAKKSCLDSSAALRNIIDIEARCLQALSLINLNVSPDKLQLLVHLGSFEDIYDLAIHSVVCVLYYEEFEYYFEDLKAAIELCELGNITFFQLKQTYQLERADSIRAEKENTYFRENSWKAILGPFGLFF